MDFPRARDTDAQSSAKSARTISSLMDRSIARGTHDVYSHPPVVTLPSPTPYPQRRRADAHAHGKSCVHVAYGITEIERRTRGRDNVSCGSPAFKRRHDDVTLAVNSVGPTFRSRVEVILRGGQATFVFVSINADATSQTTREIRRLASRPRAKRFATISLRRPSPCFFFFYFSHVFRGKPKFFIFLSIDLDISPDGHACTAYA